MKKSLSYIFIICTLSALCHSCIEYDMSYPRILAEFTTFNVEGAESVNINPDKLTVSIVLDESADISKVRVLDVALNDKAVFKNGEMPEILDLRTPYHVMLSMYQDYRWTITAEQTVDRYIKCVNQVGKAVFHEAEREAFVYVSDNQRLRFLEVVDMKLELLGSVVLSTEGKSVIDNVVVNRKDSCAFPMVIDFTNSREFTVASKGDTTVWKVTAVPVEVPAQITGIAPWCWSADIYATFSGSSESPVLMYKRKDVQDWKTLADSLIVVDGVNISARLDSLEAATEYDVKLIFDGEELPGETFMTDAPAQLPNFSFDDWWYNNKTWWVYGESYDDADRIWDSANPGTGSLIGMNLTTPEETDVISGKALRMQSKFVMVKFAAGNLFTGKFNGLVGMTGADLEWGTAFTSKPKSLKGYFKYAPQLVDYKDNVKVNNPTESDICQIQVILIDTERPFQVLPMGGVNGPTYDGKMVDLNDSEYILGRGVKNYGSTEGEWVEFEIPIEYSDPTRKPTYVIVTCASSYLGDYFTGADGSVMLVDEFEFIYQ